MSDFTIRTNNVPRNIIQGYELTENERKEFDYIDAENFDSHSFFRFKGNVYDMSEFMRVPANSVELKGWHGMHGDTYFSGILVKYVDDNERVIVAQYFA